jgi:hypothetical protein
VHVGFENGFLFGAVFGRHLSHPDEGAQRLDVVAVAFGLDVNVANVVRDRLLVFFQPFDTVDERANWPAANLDELSPIGGADAAWVPVWTGELSMFVIVIPFLFHLMRKREQRRHMPAPKSVTVRAGVSLARPFAVAAGGQNVALETGVTSQWRRLDALCLSSFRLIKHLVQRANGHAQQFANLDGRNVAPRGGGIRSIATEPEVQSPGFGYGDGERCFGHVCSDVLLVPV